MKVKVVKTHKLLEDILVKGDIVTLEIIQDDKGLYHGYEVTIADGRVYGNSMLANMIGPIPASELFEIVYETESKGKQNE